MDSVRLKNGYTIVHEVREMTNFRTREFDGMALAHDGHDTWVAARQIPGKSMDGYPNGEWWQGNYFGTPNANVVNMRDAIMRYFERAREIGVGDGMFQQRTHEAVARYLVARMDLSDVPVLVAGWGRTSDDGEGVMAPMGHTIPLAGPEAVYELLGYMRRTEDPHPAQEIPWALTPVKAWEHVIGSADQLRHTGQIKFQMGYNTYSLSIKES